MGNNTTRQHSPIKTLQLVTKQLNRTSVIDLLELLCLHEHNVMMPLSCSVTCRGRPSGWTVSVLLLLVCWNSHIATGFAPGHRPSITTSQNVEGQTTRMPWSSAPTTTTCSGTRPVQRATVLLFGKKAKRKGAGGGGGGKPRGSQQPAQEKQSVQEARFDAATRQFMFTLVGLTKILPDKSKTILKNINLSFYPGAKIGVVGLNGSGKSTLLKIMAGLDTEFDGTARPLPGASIGYLAQEPELKFETVQECIDEAVQSSQAILDEYTELSMKLADPDLSPQEMDTVMTRTEALTNQIEAANLWELDRIVSRAMDSLRVPPGDAKISGMCWICRTRTRRHETNPKFWFLTHHESLFILFIFVVDVIFTILLTAGRPYFHLTYSFVGW